MLEEPANYLCTRNLADDILKRLEDPISTVSLNDRIPAPSPNERNSRMDEWVEQVSYFDRVGLARMLEAERSIDAWDEDVLERTQRHLAELLGDMPRDERQALVLSAALGFSTSEIADFQNRPLAAIEALIDAASRRLQNDSRFEDLRETEETMARKDIRDERKRHSAQR